METRPFSKSWFSPIVNYSILAWTIICFVGTWFVLIKYGILLEGFVAILVTFFIAASIWAIPFAGLVLLSLYLTPSDESPYILFKDLIKRGLKKNSDS